MCRKDNNVMARMNNDIQEKRVQFINPRKDINPTLCFELSPNSFSASVNSRHFFLKQENIVVFLYLGSLSVSISSSPGQ